MRRYSRAIVWLGALLVAALIVAGCSDGDAPAASSVEPTEISATATEVPPEATVPAPTEEATPTAVVPAPTEEAAPAEEPTR